MVFYHFIACQGTNVEWKMALHKGILGSTSIKTQIGKGKVSRYKTALCKHGRFISKLVLKIIFHTHVFPPPSYQHHCVDMTARCMKYEYNFYTLSPPTSPLSQLISLECFPLVQSCDVSRDKLSRLRSGCDTL